ncbi:MAG: hydrogenase nickel incorporation protein HypA/HybF [Bacteroidota bacterium]|nr:hydrogenase nickel incorporation protein HypA/HybF [Bacteroidota bacterium]
MHEIKIAEDLSSIVLQTARKENLVRVTKVSISFGQLVQIVPHIFEFAFREIVRDTIARKAKVDIEIIPVKMKCNICGTDFQLAENNFACNVCGSTDLNIIHGKELFIKSIEGE